MSKEQATEQEAQQAPASSGAAVTDETYGLRPDLYAQVTRMGPGDHAALADMLSLYPSMSRQILSVAAHHMGNAAVQRATAIVQGQRQGAPPNAKDRADVMQLFEEENGPPAANGPAAKPAVGRPPSAKDQAEVMKLFEEENGPPAAKPAAGRPPSAKDQAEVMKLFEEENGPPAAKPAVGRPPSAKDQAEVMKLFEEENGPAPAKPGVGRPPSAKDQAEVMKLFEEENGPAAAKPGVGRPPSAKDQAEVMKLFEEENGPAPAKPAAEPAWAAGARRYNEAHAEGVSEFNDLTQGSCKGADGQLDPQAVARWQRQHGVDGDGKVGPHTLAAARHVQAKAGPSGAQDARIPV